MNNKIVPRTSLKGFLYSSTHEIKVNVNNSRWKNKPKKTLRLLLS